MIFSAIQGVMVAPLTQPIPFSQNTNTLSLHVFLLPPSSLSMHICSKQSQPPCQDEERHWRLKCYLDEQKEEDVLRSGIAQLTGCLSTGSRTHPKTCQNENESNCDVRSGKTYKRWRWIVLTRRRQGERRRLPSETQCWRRHHLLSLVHPSETQQMPQRVSLDLQCHLQSCP